MKKVKVTRKNLRNGKIITAVASNYLDPKDKRLKFYNEMSTKQHLQLLGDHRKEYTEIFGKHTFGYRGEWLYKVWCFEHKGDDFLVFISKEGTVIEIVVRRPDKPDKPDPLNIDSFYEFLWNKLKQHIAKKYN